MELSEIKSALASRADEVARLLLPDGKLEKNEWVGGRLSSGDGGHSLRVIVNGDKAGMFVDFGGSAKGSNLIELWMQAKGVEFQEALTEVKAWLGVRGVQPTGGSLREKRERPRSKPSKAGVTFLASKAEFYLTVDRQIPLAVVRAFKIGMLADGATIVFPYLSETTGEAEMIKFLAIERDAKGNKKTWTSADTPKVLFGKHLIQPDARALLICEGESDAMTWHAQAIPGLCCCSVPFGAKWAAKDGTDPNEEWIGNDWDFLARFEKIYLSMDMDEPGQLAMASIVKRLGREICYVVKLPLKDANDLLKAGRGAELPALLAAAKTLDPTALKNASEFRADVLARLYDGDAATKRGIPLPFGAHPFHLRWNEWTAVTGQNSHGKSQLLGHILVYLWKLGYSCCIASMEVPVGQTLSTLISQAVGEKLPERALGERALDWLARGFWFYDVVGVARWPDVLATFKYAYRRHGVRFFVIDSWMKLGIRGDDFDAQGEFLNALSGLVHDCDIHVFVVAHPRKLKNETEVVGKMDVKGSGELTDQAHNVWVVWRNKAKEVEIAKMQRFKDEEIKITALRRLQPDAGLNVEKQRNDDGDEPRIQLWFVKASKQFYGHYRATGHSVFEGTPPTPPVVEAVTEAPDDDRPF